MRAYPFPETVSVTHYRVFVLAGGTKQYVKRPVPKSGYKYPSSWVEVTRRELVDNPLEAWLFPADGIVQELHQLNKWINGAGNACLEPVVLREVAGPAPFTRTRTHERWKPRRSLDS